MSRDRPQKPLLPVEEVSFLEEVDEEIFEDTPAEYPAPIWMMGPVEELTPIEGTYNLEDAMEFLCAEVTEAVNQITAETLPFFASPGPADTLVCYESADVFDEVDEAIEDILAPLQLPDSTILWTREATNPLPWHENLNQE